MSRIGLALLTAATAAAFAAPAAAQQQRPPIETKKVDGTEGVYVFRNGNHQSMFVVTKDGLIATDPIAYGRPTGGSPLVALVKQPHDKPVQNLVPRPHHDRHHPDVKG